MKKFFVLFCLFGATTAQGVPIQWQASQGGNNHFYDFIYDPNITWTNADAAAPSLTFDGVPGYLATITSAAESSFMAANFSAEAGPDQNGWLGGYQDTSAPDYSEPAGGWRWVTGETWSYTNWFVSGPAEPDNDGGNQNYVRSNVGFQWDDFQNDPSGLPIQYISGYFVEYSVPEPSALPVLVLGVSAMLGMRRQGKCRV